MKVENLVPQVYYKESRDFAYIGRLFEIVFNYIKTNADLVSAKSISENANPLVVKLITDTLGFKPKHEYITKDLISLASVFTSLLRDKGSEKAINLAVQILLNSQKLKGNINQQYLNKDLGSDSYDWAILIPSEMKDVVLLEDLFDYILPAGVTYQIITTSFSSIENITVISSSDLSDIIHYDTKQLGQITSENNKEEDLVRDEQGNAKDRSTFYTGTIITNIGD